MPRVKRSSLYASLTDSGFSAADYSRFKYGDNRVARTYALHMAEQLLRHAATRRQLETGEVTIMPSAYLAVPTAAAAIAMELYRYLRQRGYPVTYTTLQRSSLAEHDYGTFDRRQRAAIMKRQIISCHAPHLVSGRHIIVVDDVRVTGSHEAALRGYFAGVAAVSVRFFYVIDLAASHRHQPGIEHVMNHAGVSSLSDLIELMCSHHFRLNARVCKFILDAQRQANLPDFLDELPTFRLRKLYQAARADGYNRMPDYAAGFAILQAMYRSRNTVPRTKPLAIPAGGPILLPSGLLTKLSIH